MKLSNDVLRPDVVEVHLRLRQDLVLGRKILPDQFFEVESVDELVLAAFAGILVDAVKKLRLKWDRVLHLTLSEYANSCL